MPERGHGSQNSERSASASSIRRAKDLPSGVRRSNLIIGDTNTKTRGSRADTGMQQGPRQMTVIAPSYLLEDGGVCVTAGLLDCCVSAARVCFGRFGQSSPHLRGVRR